MSLFGPATAPAAELRKHAANAHQLASHLHGVAELATAGEALPEPAQLLDAHKILRRLAASAAGCERALVALALSQPPEPS